jgi:outer membrane protein TolC
VLAQHLLDVGKIPRFDLLRTQADAAGAQQQLANARAEISATLALLAQAMGVPAVALQAPAEEAPAGMPPDGLEAALSSRPDLLAARKQVAAAQAAVRSRRAEYKPQVYGMAMLDGLVPSVMGTSVGVTVGVVAGVPLVDGGRRQAEVGEAEQAVARAQAAVTVLEQQVRAEVLAAEARAGAACENMDTAARQVTAAEEAYRVAQIRYEAGKSIVVELLDALRSQTEARENLVIARSQYAKALAELYRAMGVVVLQGK